MKYLYSKRSNKITRFTFKLVNGQLAYITLMSVINCDIIKYWKLYKITQMYAIYNIMKQVNRQCLSPLMLLKLTNYILLLCFNSKYFNSNSCDI